MWNSIVLIPGYLDQLKAFEGFEVQKESDEAGESWEVDVGKC